jgi:LacI family transcriptional regulator
VADSPKPTVHDIARVAGVSLATVDRVLNARPGVRRLTVDRVEEAIRALGFVRDLSAANLARKREYRFAFLLPAARGEFLATIRAAIDEAALAMARDRVSLRLIAPAADDPHTLARTIAALSGDSVDGVAIMARESPLVRDAITHLADRGVAVVTLVTDLPTSGRLHFVGVNNVAAGRTAALLMGRFLPGRPRDLLVVAESMQSRDALERRLGFDAVIGSEFPHLRVLPSLESHDDADRLARILARSLRDSPDAGGIYAMAGDNAAFLAALRAVNRSDLVVVAHDLTEATRAGLRAGLVQVVINQDAGHLVRSALRLLRAHCDQRPVVASQERVRIEVLLRENLP